MIIAAIGGALLSGSLLGAGAANADVYYKNCSEARKAGVTPLYEGDPGYAPHLDRDRDGIPASRTPGTTHRKRTHVRKPMATEEKVAECVAHYRGLLDSRPPPPESLSQAPDSRLHVIIGRAGAKRRSQALLARLDQAFKEAGITTFPPLTDPYLKPSDRVCMLDAKQPVKGLASQRHLLA